MRCRLADALATARDRSAFIFFGRRRALLATSMLLFDDVSFVLSFRIWLAVFVGSLSLDGGVSLLDDVVARNNDKMFVTMSLG